MLQSRLEVECFLLGFHRNSHIVRTYVQNKVPHSPARPARVASLGRTTVRGIRVQDEVKLGCRDVSVLNRVFYQSCLLIFNIQFLSHTSIWDGSWVFMTLLYVRVQVLVEVISFGSMLLLVKKITRGLMRG